MQNFQRVLSVLTGVLVAGCATSGTNSKTDLKNPDPLEQHFGHVLFNDSTQHFPALRPAAPKTHETPQRTAKREPAPLDVARADTATRRPLIVPDESAQGTERARIPHADYTAPKRVKTRAEPKRTRRPKTKTANPTGPKRSVRVPSVPKKPKAPKNTDRLVRIEPAARPAPKQAAKPSKGLGDGSRRGEIVAAARRLIGVETNFDEQGFLIHLLQVADIEVEAESGQDIVKALYDKMNGENAVYGPSKQPVAGDIIFFSNTYDRDDDGRTDDWFTMAGVVERYDPDGTVTFVGFAKGKIERMYMNAARPSAERNETSGKTLNSQLREKKLADRPFTLYFAGELFASYGAIE
jgi:hypothetical protein